MVYLSVLTIGFILALSLKNRIFDIPFFRTFLLISLTFELVNRHFATLGNNWVINNVYTIFTVTYYLWVFKLNRFQLLGNIFLWVYVILTIFYLYKQNPNSYFHGVRYNVGMLMTFFSILIYFRYLMLYEYKKNFFKNELVWMGFGIVLFYVCSFPILTFAEYFTKNETAFGSALFDLVQLGNVFLYLGYVMAILCPYLIKK